MSAGNVGTSPDGAAPTASVPVVTPDPAEAESQPPAGHHLSRGVHSARGVRRHLRAMRMVLNALLLLALLYTITITKALLIPLVLAAFIGLALNPVVATGVRWHLPRWLASSVLMLGLIAGIGSGVGLLAQPAAGWFRGAPAAIRSFIPKLSTLTRPLKKKNTKRLTQK